MLRLDGVCALLAPLLWVAVALSLASCSDDDHGNSQVPESITSRLPDSGQTKCYQGESPFAEIPCANTGQDGAYAINAMTYSDNGDGTVKDDIAGLIWQQSDAGANMAWYDAVTYCAELDLAGHDDWRLPSIKELESLVDYSSPLTGQSLSPVFSGGGAPCWSSNERVDDPEQSWALYSGGAIDSGSKEHRYSVKCVRGNQYSDGTLVDNGNRTVTSNESGLMWQQEGAGEMLWNDALAYCEELSLAGHDNWRLPNIKELNSLTDYTRHNPAIDNTLFRSVQRLYWSSTTITGFPYDAWVVNTEYGNMTGLGARGGRGGLGDKEGNNFSPVYVRCVR